MSDLYESLSKGFNNAFINKDTICEDLYRPSFVYNDYKNGHKVGREIENGLMNCDEFFISVAFITDSGLNTLKLALANARDRKIKGKILTTDYLNFTEPKALVQIMRDYPNIELRMFKCKEGDIGFHTKGYIFRTANIYNMIIGSSNLTDKALSENAEWNSRIVSTSEGEFLNGILVNFNDLWNKSVSMNEWIETYTRIYNEQKEIGKKNFLNSVFNYVELKPNEMQVSFTEEMRKLIDNNGKRGLLISATGTGKTYASAFALRDLHAKRVLFLAHRSKIL